jgi:hypothetical protein
MDDNSEVSPLSPGDESGHGEARQGSVWMNIVAVVVSPDSVLGEIAETSVAHAKWLIPLILYCIVSVASIQVLVVTPNLRHEFRETIDAVLQPSLQEQISKGSLTQGQADWLRAFITPGTPEFLTAQGIGTVVAGVATLFALALIFWQLGKSAMNYRAPFMKVVELVGMTFVIASIERCATTGLMIMSQSIYATPGLGLLVLDSAPQSLSFLILSRFNLFTFWELGFISRGLSILLGRDFPKVLVLVGSLWLLWSVVTLLPLFGSN